MILPWPASGKSTVQAFVKRDRRVKYLALPGAGEEEARNRAVASSRAPHLMFLTAGDVVEKESLDTHAPLAARDRLVLRRRHDRNREGQDQLDVAMAAGNPR